MTTHETELLAANAALELEVVRLRDALETFIAEHEECEDGDGWMAQMCSMEALHVADEAVSTPFTPTALSAMIAKVSEMMRQRAISAGSAINPIYGGLVLQLTQSAPYPKQSFLTFAWIAMIALCLLQLGSLLLR